MAENLWKSVNDNGEGIGNMHQDYELDDYEKRVENYFGKNPVLQQIKGEYFDESDYNYALMGGSEYYLSRVCEKVTVYYSDEDIYLVEIAE